MNEHSEPVCWEDLLTPYFDEMKHWAVFFCDEEYKDHLHRLDTRLRELASKLAFNEVEQAEWAAIMEDANHLNPYNLRPHFHRVLSFADLYSQNVWQEQLGRKI